MKRSYPIIMTQGKEFIVVFIPDFNINTQGRDIPDAVKMAYDAIKTVGIDMLDSGERLPDASNIENLVLDSGATVALVDISFIECCE